MEYEHTQRGYLALIVFFWLLIVLAILLALAGDERGAAALSVGISGAIVMVVVIWFSVLRIRISTAEVRVSFGGGWPRKIIPLDDVAGYRQVRNKWYYGWGIRRTPAGWMYNVWGLDAVQIERTNGKSFIIGTNEPKELIAALQAQQSLRH